MSPGRGWWDITRWVMAVAAGAAFVVAAGSGVVLTVFYRPNVSASGERVAAPTRGQRFSAVMQDVHRWAAYVLVVLALVWLVVAIVAWIQRRARGRVAVSAFGLVMVAVLVVETGFSLAWVVLRMTGVTIGGRYTGLLRLFDPSVISYLADGRELSRPTMVAVAALHIGPVLIVAIVGATMAVNARRRSAVRLTV